MQYFVEDYGQIIDKNEKVSVFNLQYNNKQ